MFRDSRGVVHTVSAGDPLDDLPADAARALQEALLVPTGGDLGGALERCEAVRELVERWQDAFFAALPDDVDLEEEGRWAAEAGLSLAEVEADYEDDPYDEPFEDDEDDNDEEGDALDAQLAALPFVDPSRPTDPDDPRAALGEELVSVLERELLLLPFRVRLEALVAAGELAGSWADLLADHEKVLGHLVLAHGAPQDALAHDALADAHAALHAGTGPGHDRSSASST
ncbi:MAG: hypothetical protein JWN17_3164 [Frankiales bacterium]|nr:hypothetical protein [Frankiales bacterium]